MSLHFAVVIVLFALLMLLFCFVFLADKVVFTHINLNGVQCPKLAHNGTMKNDSAQIPSVHKVRLTIYESWCLGTQESVHCPLMFLEKIYELIINACDVHR